MSQTDRTREHLIETYRKKAKHYDITSRLYPVPGYPLEAQRRRAVQTLQLRPGGTVVDLACGTGQNFPLIEQAIGPDVLNTLSQQTGLSREELLSRLTQDLPAAVDKFTPAGRLPTEDEAARLI